MLGNSTGKCLSVAIMAMLMAGAFAVSVGWEGGEEAKAEPAPATMNYITHAPIRINSNAEFASKAASEGWPGNGTAGNPYVIQNYEINGTGFGYCIYIGNTTCRFVIRNCYLHHASGVKTYPYYWDTVLTCWNAQNGTVHNNTFQYANFVGTYFNSCNYTIVRDNNASYNKDYAIYFDTSYYCAIMNNQIFLNTNCGIVVGAYSYFNTIDGNMIKSNSDSGIYLANTNNNTIVNNDVSLSSNYGINMWSNANYNKIHHNNVYSNSLANGRNSGTNYWHNGYPTGGNYWGNYAGTDIRCGASQDVLGADGIGDTWYNTSGVTSGQDRYPLTKKVIGGKVQRPPIRINSNAEFTPQNGVSAGDGTIGNPYIIENYDIDGSAARCCIYVGNTTMHFVVRNCALHHAGGGTFSEPYYPNSGLALYNVQNGTASANAMTYNSAEGIYAAGVRNCRFDNNTLTNNLDSGFCATLGSTYNALYDNNASSNQIGIVLRDGTSWNTISGNLMYGNGNIGLSIYNGCQHNTVSDNMVGSSGNRGIYLWVSSSYNVITGNTVDLNGYGIYVYSYSEYNLVSRNIVNASTNNGIALVTYCTGTNVSQNDVSNNSIGISVYQTADAIVFGNAIHDNDYGIYLQNAATSPQIWANNLVNNSIQGYDDAITPWNNSYPAGGNYWSNYTGIDNMSGPNQDQPGSDGFGDTPFIIDADSRDNYPLMAPWNGSMPSVPSPSFKIPVVAGWNLISIPLVPWNTTLPAPLIDLDGDTAWDRVQWYDAFDVANPWKLYYTGWDPILNDLTDVNHTMGLQVNITSAGDGFIRVNGTLPGPTEIPLWTGWNMVGYPAIDDSAYTVGQLKADTGVTTVEKDTEDGTLNVTTLLDAYVLKRGEGYWFNVSANCVWTLNVGLQSHAPIRIDSNADFDAAHGVSGGNGTSYNPWIVENWDINGSGHGYCIYVGNTTDYFMARYCNLHEASGVGSAPYYPNTGIVIYNGTNGAIINNTVSNNDEGIYLDSSGSNTIVNNTASNNGYGIYILFSSSNTIVKNTASSNNYSGIALSSSGSNTIANNVASNNFEGIYLGHSILSAQYSNNNTVVNNTAFSNAWGIFLISSSNNTIYHNNLLNNTIQASDDRNDNYWDDGYPSGGNYWSDYAGFDNMSGPDQDIIGSDGIGDMPYIIDADSRDNYPLMTPWNSSPPSPEPSTYFYIPVVAGWNLISTPLVPATTSMHGVLADLDGDTLWDRVRWYDAFDGADHWKQYYSGWSPALNDLPNVDHRMGVWINVTDLGDGFIRVGGLVANSTDIPLRTGWNMVGYPTLNSTMKVSDALWGTSADVVEVFDSGAMYRTKVVGPTYVMKPGEGYWIHVTSDSVWTVDWLGVPQGDTIPPTIVSTWPVDGQTNVNTVPATYMIHFSEPMNTSAGSVLTNLPGISWAWSADGYFLNGTYGALLNGTVYYANLTAGGFKDLAGNALAGDAYRIFTTVYGVPPNATATGPASNGTGISRPNITYDWYFTPTSVYIYYTNNFGSTWALWGTDFSVDGVWAPGADLPSSGTYYWNARAMGVTNESAPSGSGSIEAGPYLLDKYPEIVLTSPADGASMVSTAPGTYVIQFSEPMNATCGIVSSNLPNASWSWDPSWTFLNGTYSALQNSMVYYVDLTGGGFVDLTGNPLIGDAYKTFATISGGAMLPLRINSDAQFASMAATYGWPGDGSPISPYIIQGYDINGTNYGYCIYIGNTSVDYIVRDCSLHHVSGSAYLGAVYTAYNSLNGSLQNCTITNSSGYQVYIRESSNMNVSGNRVNTTTFSNPFYLYMASYNIMIDNLLETSWASWWWMYYGYYMLYSSNNAFVNNTVIGFQNSTHMTDSHNNSFVGNKFYFINSGIYGYKTNYTTVIGNTMEQGITWNAYYGGVYLSEARIGTVIRDNCIITSIVSGIHLYFSSDALAENNTITVLSTYYLNPDGIRLSYSDAVTLLNNTLYGNGINMQGNTLEQWRSHAIVGNTLNGTPIYYYRDIGGFSAPTCGQLILANCSDVDIDGMSFQIGKRALQFAYSTGISITNCTISGQYYGIYLYNCQGTLVADNNISFCNYSYNGVGVYSDSTNGGATIRNNTFYMNYYGVSIYSNSLITLNRFVRNGYYGLYIGSGTGNLIYHNSFENNTYQARSVSGNAWNEPYPSGGNYWSSYSGNDQYSGPGQDVLGADGIGDTRYTPWTEYDNYPLMMPWGLSNPFISLTTPLDGASNVTTDAGQYSIRFSEQMNTASGSIAAIVANLPGASWAWDASGYWLNSSYSALSNVTTYFVNLSACDFADMEGNILKGDTYKTFRTGPVPWAMATGPVGLSNIKRPTITYSFGFSPTSVQICYSYNGGATWYTYGTDTTVDGSWTTTSDLTNGYTYYWNAMAIGSENEASPSGAASIEAGPYTVDTSNPVIASTAPADGETGVATTPGTYLIIFNEPMNTSAGSVLTNLPSASWTWSPNGLYLNGTYSDLGASTTYYVDLTSRGFKDVAGGSLAGDTYKVFSTGTVGGGIYFTKSVDRAAASPGDFLNYTLCFNNTGALTYSDVWINDTLPIGTIYISDDASTLPEFSMGFVNGQECRFWFTYVEPGDHYFTIAVMINWTVSDGTVLVNTANCTYTTDSNTAPSTSSASASTTIYLSDTAPPASNVDVIDPYAQTSSPLTANATASDSGGSGVASVELWWRYSTNNATWGGWSCFGADYAAPWQWSFVFPNGPGYYQFYSRAWDGAGNYENQPGLADTRCQYINGQVSRGPIRIDSNAEFDIDHGVSAGNGTQLSPYIIENWDISGSGFSYCIYVGNTTAYFIIRNCTLHDASGSASQYYWCAGIAFHNVQNGAIENSNASHNYYGVYLEYSNWNTISGNTIFDNDLKGLAMDYCANNRILRNSFDLNYYWGVTLANSNDNRVENNTIMRAEWYGGIQVGWGSNNVINGNNISDGRNNSGGISIITDAYGTWVTNNTISGARYAVTLSQCNYTLMFDNRIENNAIAIYIIDCYWVKHRIWHNTIINSTLISNDTGSNIWNDTYPSGGNYWSAYTGIDVMSGPNQDIPGPDGIGDMPYVLDADSIDYYPLMSPWNGSVLPDMTVPSHSNEYPAPNSTASNSTPVISVIVTDWGSGVNASTIRLYINGFSVMYDLAAVPGGYNVSYWHESGFSTGEMITCRIVAYDMEGNKLDYTWSFTSP